MPPRARSAQRRGWLENCVTVPIVYQRRHVLWARFPCFASRSPSLPLHSLTLSACLSLLQLSARCEAVSRSLW